jgi:hypothetical protein
VLEIFFSEKLISNEDNHIGQDCDECDSIIRVTVDLSCQLAVCLRISLETDDLQYNEERALHFQGHMDCAPPPISNNHSIIIFKIFLLMNFNWVISQQCYTEVGHYAC